MSTDAAAIARHLAQRGQDALNDNRPLESLDLFERAYTVAVTGACTTPISFKLLPRQKIPKLSSEQHIVSYITKQGIVFYAMIGHICSNATESISGAESFRCIFDVGDGMDTGGYHRFSYSSTLRDSTLILDPYFYIYDNYNDLRIHAADHAKPWRDRKDILFWRGTTTGRRRHTPAPDAPLTWDWLPRLQLCAVSRASRFAAKMDIAIVEMGQISEPYLRDAITSAGFIQSLVPKSELIEYKYLIYIDGNSNSWSIIEKLIVVATVFKVKSADGFHQWHYHRLKDWETHIPVAPDLSDLDERLGWALTHPEDCARIAANGAALAAEIQLSSALREAEQALSANWTAL